MEQLRSLKDLTVADAPIVGGKAAALAELMRAGFRVPDGFVVGADAEMDDTAVVAAFRRLASPLVAVRSSAAVEDGASESWAGQFETELNVGENGLVENIRRCRESGSSRRAKAYETRGTKVPGKFEFLGTLVPSGAVTIPVLVQTMIPAVVAGVAFSMNPVTGENVVTIEAVRGLGDELVSGRVSPDPDALTADETIEIVEAVRWIESHLGYPVDVEWAIANGELWILQARPITGM